MSVSSQLPAAETIVTAAETVGLLLMPLAAAKAFTMALVERVMGAVNSAEFALGVEPSSV